MQFTQVDVKNIEFIDLMEVDYIVHLAFSTNIPNSVRHPIETTYANIDMTIHLLQYAKEAGVKKLLFPSTASLYSHNPTPWKEDMIPDPIEPYSWQKLACEQACKMYSKQYGLPTVITRFFQVYGENQRKDTAISKFLRLKDENEPITLTETTAQSTFKSGQRDFIYAGDLAKAVRILIEADTEDGEIFNVASGKVHTMEEIAEALDAEVKWIPKREYEVERHEGDIKKLKKLGWSPKVDVLDWLAKQI
jgi:UDP-glucose 4-epimerase